MRALVIGAARSGIASAKYLLKQGHEVILSDSNAAVAPEVEAAFDGLRPTFIWGEQPDIMALRPNMVVLSPGVPLTIAPVAVARTLGLPVISEPELAFRESKAPFVGITGTNGKTTTTALTAALLEGAYERVLCAGNIGVPLIEEAPSLAPEDVVVAELSSFQLESTILFRPKVALFLNLTPDHLDRHKTMGQYGKAKAQIFANQRAEDALVYNADDKAVARLAKGAKSRRYGFSRKEAQDPGIWCLGDRIEYRLSEGEAPRLLMEREVLFLPGDHNLENAMAGAMAALLMGQSPEQIRQVLRTFRGVAHRMEPVAEIDGIRYVNDSKGTNPDATLKALASYEAPIVALLGGRNKGSDFTPLAKAIDERARFAVVFGEAVPDFLAAFANVGFERYQVVGDMAEAVEVARAHAQAGDVVLLSPACASWDSYPNFEVRGEDFKNQVRALEEESR